jgi:glutathione transport system permease protein
MATTIEDATALAAADTAVRSPWSEFWRKFKRQKVAVVAGAFVVALVVVAIAAPWIVPYHAENFFDYDKLNARPSWQHWFGVDALGRDIFSRILMGARISLAAGFASVAVGALFGTLLGLAAGYYEGWWDRVIMRACDVLFAFPGILLAIGIVAILGGGMTNVIVAVAIFSIPTFARLVRGNTLALKHLTFIEAARSIGASDWTIISRHIFPGTISAVVVYFSLRISVDHHRGQPVVPRHGRAAAAHPNGARCSTPRARRCSPPACRDLSRAGDLRHRARVQPAGRQAARRTRPEDRTAMTRRSLPSLYGRERRCDRRRVKAARVGTAVGPAQTR